MKIFIIEDEPAIREELTQLFEKYGYQCASSSDFQHIAETALSSGADLILLDINLPYQDGFQVCREIRQKSNLPIIVLTSRNSDFDELMSLNIGADDYISKPYNAQVLLALKQLTETTDNIYRYGLLQKLGAKRKQINRTLFTQTAVFFAIPLTVAGIYSAFLIGKAMTVVEEFMNIHISTNIGLTIILFLIVYGSYFLATYLSCKRIVTEQKKLEV